MFLLNQGGHVVSFLSLSMQAKAENNLIEMWLIELYWS